MKGQQLASLLLRLGIAFSFAYASIAAFINPTSWIGFLPTFLQNNTFLNIFSTGEIVLAIWLISGWKTFYPALLSALAMLGIIIFNLGALDIVFRDVTILLAALALAALTYNKQ